ncbi:protein CNPPD1-like [Ylistrum balloti]|uniref:protein CNPPD1-like n=1 Tax=Ylistrum balloti TaxID=509963 RepID=UPI002905D9EA|nr:protein CNPPD1-like [Ylistrum balloti]
MQPFYLPFFKGNDRLNGFDEEDHEEFAERLRKTLYYGKTPSTDRPSLPLTEITVEYLQEACPRQLGKLDTYTAATTSRQACMSPCSIMMSMLYVKRLKTRNPAYLQQISSSDLFLISVMMASKFLYDEGIDDEVFNDEWAASADLETEEVNEMERQFLSAIDWQLFVKPNEFYDILHDLERRIALRQARDRGWFTYTDLMVLSEDPEIARLVAFLSQEISKVVMVSSFAYLASVLTMVGSTLLVTTMSTAIMINGPVILTPPLPSLPETVPKGLHGRCNNTSPVVKTPVDTVTTDVSGHGNEETTRATDRSNEGLSVLKNAVDGLLSLFTVVSLRETFVKHMYGNKDTQNTYDQHLIDYPQSTNIAQRPNKSVTINYGNSNEQVQYPIHGCASCEKHEPNGNERSRNVQTGTNPTQCVVDHDIVYAGFKDLMLYDHFSDISLGFSTGLRSPALLHT